MSEPTYSQGDLDDAQLQAALDAEFKSAFDKALAKAKPEVTTPQGEWFLWVRGVRLFPQRFPQKMIKVGDEFLVETVVWFNPIGGQLSPCNRITQLAKSIDITYHTANLDRWTLGPAPMNTTHVVPIVPGRCWYIDPLRLRAQSGWEACYEMNICAQITGCQPGSRPPFAGFATAVYDYDPDRYPWLWPWLPGAPSPFPGVAPRWEFDIPLRFMIYP